MTLLPTSFPTGADYRDALQNPASCFADPDLAAGVVELDSIGLPRPRSGNFASVFRVVTPTGQRFAVKCFTRFAPDQQRRYAAIGEELRARPRPWAVGFELLERGVRVYGRWYPALKMEWVEAQSLIGYIETHLWEPERLAALAKQFGALVGSLRLDGLAHGDLQHGNLLVTEDGTLRLIDYDGMYVPALDGCTGTERGHPHYQPPGRRLEDFGPQVDAFSCWVIHLCLVALVHDPSLWIALDGGDDCLLFRQTDFGGPTTPARRALQEHDLPPLRDAGDALRRICEEAQRGSVPPLDSTAGMVPADLTVRFREVGAPTRTAAWAMPVLAAIVLILAVSGIVAGSAAALLVALVAVASTVTQWLFFLSTPEYRRRRCQGAVVRDRRRTARLASIAVEAAEVALRAHDREWDRRDGPRGSRSTDQTEQQRAELADIERWVAHRRTAYEMERAALRGAELSELANSLRLLQRAHVIGALAATPLDPRHLQGLPSRSLRALAASGIRTAADFTTVTPARVEGRFDHSAFFWIRSGQTRRVPGFGFDRIQTIRAWRRDTETAARATQPAALPSALAAAIRAKYYRQAKVLDERNAQLPADAATYAASVRRREAVRQSRLDRHASGGRHKAALVRERLVRELTEAQRVNGLAERDVASVERGLASYSEIRLDRFVRRALTG